MRYQLLLFALALSTTAPAETITIVTGSPAPQPLAFAAAELAKYLQRIYADDRITQAESPPPTGKSIVLKAGVKDIAPGGYRIHNDGDTLFVEAAEAAAAPHAVYALLCKLGCAFDFGGEAVPAPRPAGSFDSAACIGEDHPLARDRYIFNWHNFLSSCTTWSLPDWERWMTDGLKTGYNGIMIHCYPNNPMIPGEFKGARRPVGYLATSRQGRDWCVQHVNDVRRIPGGSVFDNAVFGSDAVLPLEGQPAAEQASAVRTLMQRVFAEAERRGLKIHLAIDSDTALANPQEMIGKLPASARYIVPYAGLKWLMDPPGDLWLVRPDTPEGYGYIKEQARQLLALYPQLDEINFWRRAKGALSSQMKREHLPADWLAEFDAKLATLPAELPEHMQDDHAWNFELSKRIGAWRRACRELGRPDMRFASGSWRPHWIASAAWWLSPDTRLVMLDSEIRRTPHTSLRHNPKLGPQIAEIVQPRGRFVPVIWSHHDDGEYVGAHLEPYPEFTSLLGSWNADSFAVIHWLPRLTSRHLQHHGRQVWAATRNESLQDTIGWWNASRYPKEIAGSVTALELERAGLQPAFGRETTDRFIDRPLKRFLARHRGLTPEAVIEAAHKRRDGFDLLAKQLAKGNAARRALESQADYELFSAELWDTQLRAEQVAAMLKDGRDAKLEAEKLDARPALEAFANMLEKGPGGPGPRGLLVSMALRWWPEIEDLRQRAGVSPIRIQFAPTRHEELAFARSKRSWWIDPSGMLWKALGAKETGAPIVSRAKPPSHEDPTIAELSASGLRCENPVRIPLGTVLAHPVPAGGHHIQLILTGLAGANANARCEVKLLEEDGKAAFNATGSVSGSETTVLEGDFALQKSGRLTLWVAPQVGEVVVCGLVID